MTFIFPFTKPHLTLPPIFLLLRKGGSSFWKDQTRKQLTGEGQGFEEEERPRRCLKDVSPTGDGRAVFVTARQCDHFMTELHT